MIVIFQEFQEKYEKYNTFRPYLKTHTWTIYKFQWNNIWLEHYD